MCYLMPKTEHSEWFDLTINCTYVVKPKFQIFEQWLQATDVCTTAISLTLSKRCSASEKLILPPNCGSERWAVLAVVRALHGCFELVWIGKLSQYSEQASRGFWDPPGRPMDHWPAVPAGGLDHSDGRTDRIQATTRSCPAPLSLCSLHLLGNAATLLVSSIKVFICVLITVRLILISMGNVLL